jgi:protein-tyrosine phosphatase
MNGGILPRTVVANAPGRIGYAVVMRARHDTIASIGSARQRLAIASLPNLRDVGGYATAGGSLVRTGLVYRSSELSPIGPDGMRELAALGLKYAFDLRTAAEAASRPDELPDGVERVWLDVFADQEQADPARLDTLLANPLEANARVGGGRMDALMARAYRSFVTLSSAKGAYGRLFASLADAGNVPSLFHCTAGKDRTGWAAAALLALLGVPRDTVVEDYLLSNDSMLAHYRPVIDRFVDAGGEPGIVQAIFGVKRKYLEAAFDEVERRHETIEQYFAGALGIDGERQDDIRSLYLDGDASQTRG